jgi:hypothetical protein
MIKIGIGGSADIQKIHRLTGNVHVLVGYPDGVMHPVYVGHKTTKTGKQSKKRAFSILLSTLQNSDLARVLHFGSAHTVARPFLYDAIRSVKTELKMKLRMMHQKSIERGESGVTGEFSPEGIGAFLVGAVQKLVRGGYYKGTAPNAQWWIDIKGGDTPLIDTGFLMQSTTFVTRKYPPKLTAKKIETHGETPG